MTEVVSVELYNASSNIFHILLNLMSYVRIC